jgi:hypothetical protein
MSNRQFWLQNKSKPRDAYIFFSFSDKSDNQCEPAAWPLVWVFWACRDVGNGITPDVAKKRIGGSAVPICAQLPEVADNLGWTNGDEPKGLQWGHCDGAHH